MNRTCGCIGWVFFTLLFASAAEPESPKAPWSLKPVEVSAVPKIQHATLAANDVDRFLLAKLETKKLTFNKQADPRTQIRRVYFDLIGLPPSQDVIDDFVKNPTDEAYSKIVEDLLKSPHYGERAARLWLDLVRYAESDGFERNQPRANAWPYRDWVIEAFNADMPYDRFAKLQLAGDVLEPDNPAAIRATGFLVAGIHNTVVGVNPVMQKNARQDELEDIISGVGQTFLGMSVQCARCHDHKFDPVSMTDYYRLAATLGGVNFGERDISAAITAQLRKDNPATTRIAELEKLIAAQESQGRDRVLAKRGKDAKPAIPKMPFLRWTFEKDTTDVIQGVKAELHAGAAIKNGRLILKDAGAFLKSEALPKPLREKTLEVWVSPANLDQRGGGALTVETNDGTVFDSIVFGERVAKTWMAGSNGFLRTVNNKADAETLSGGALLHMAIVYSANHSITIYRNGKLYMESYTPKNQQLQTYTAQQSRILMGLRHTGGGNAAFVGEIEEARIYDKALGAEDIAESYKAGHDGIGVNLADIIATLTKEEILQRENWMQERKQLEAKLPKPGVGKVYAVMPRQPTATHVLARGNVERPKDEVTAGAVLAVGGKHDFGLKSDATDAERRKKLAEWITAPENPLFARVIVNRLWQQHFGVGLVETPSDFGNNGAKPSHPELLDWLANELVRQKYSLKAIHKMLVTSAAYRQSSAKNAEAVKLDADNRLLWRKSPARLEAEMIRDAILFTSGQLNTTAGGPGFKDTREHGNAGTTFYEPIDPEGSDFNRRTIYRFSPRGERSPVLETFDCPDPSAQTPRRQVTTTPLQALALWNNKAVLRMADKFAERVTVACQQQGDTSTEAQVKQAYRFALGRLPTAEETKLTVVHVEKHGLAALARVLFNSNEFVVIE